MRYTYWIHAMVILGLNVGSVSGEPLNTRGAKEKQIVARNMVTPLKISSGSRPAQLQPSKIRTPTPMPVYKPPKRGAPGGRVGGGTRGDYDPELTVYVLAPKKATGLTSQDQPELYWYLSKQTKVPIEFTLIDEEGIDPLIETRLPSPSQAGIQRIQFSDFGVQLSSDKMYRWSVALVLDPEHRSKDIVAGARIQRARPSDIALHKREQPDSVQDTFTNAEAGLWYDAIAAISRVIRDSPEEPKYRKMRQALLSQVDLTEVAAYEQVAKAGF